MSRNSLAILAWSITTALLVSACADRPGAFKAIDLSKVQVKTQPAETKEVDKDKKSADDEKSARQRAALEENARRLRQIELDINELRNQANRSETESTLPTGKAEGKRIETVDNQSEGKKTDKTVSDSKGTEGSSIKADLKLRDDLVKAANDRKSNEIITSLIRGMDFTVILNQNGTLKLTVESLVSFLDMNGQGQQAALISTTDQNNFISTDHIVSEGKFVELTVPVDIQNSQNVMSSVKFYAGYEANKKSLVIFATYESNGAGQGGKQVGVGTVFLEFESFVGQIQGPQKEFKMKVAASSWGVNLLSVNEAQDLMAKEALERAQKEHIDNDTKNSSANDPVNDRINEEAANKTSENSRSYENTLGSAVSDPYNDRVVEEAARQEAQAKKPYRNTLKDAVSDPYNDAIENGR